MKKLIHIYEKTFGTNIYYSGVKTFKEFKKQFQKQFPGFEIKNYEMGTFINIEQLNGNQYGILWCKNDNLFVLIHEAAHAAFWLMDSKGILISKENEETFAYIQEFIVQEIMEKISKT